jgi:hypothetical protein
MIVIFVIINVKQIQVDINIKCNANLKRKIRKLTFLKIYYLRKVENTKSTLRINNYFLKSFKKYLI